MSVRQDTTTRFDASVPRRDAHAVKEMSTEALVVEYQPFVTSIVVRVRRQFNLCADVEDLEACGFLGLLEAHARFDPSVGTFGTFAYYRVRGKILDASRQHQWGDPRALQAAVVIDSLASGVPTETTIYLFADLDEAGSSPASQLDVVEHADFLRLLRAEVAALPKPQQRVLQRHHLEGATMEQVSRELGRSVSWVSRTNFRTLSRLRHTLAANC